MAASRSKLLLAGLGARVRARRVEQGLTLRALSAACGLSERFLSDVEAGKANISLVSLDELARALHLSLAEVLADAAPAKELIALLGLRGAGKSTVGKALAERLRLPFFELDALVEAEAGMRLQEIFAMHGEGYFRQVELQALEKFIDQHPRAVLAAGGGLVTSPEAFRRLLEASRTVWLKASPEEHWDRVVRQGDLRPMQNRPHAMAELRRRLKEREPLYRQAERVCSTSNRSVAAVVHTLVQALGPPQAMAR